MKSVTCDLCGKEEAWEKQFAEIKHTFGYGTSHDGLTVDFDICEECFMEIFKELL